MLPNGSVWSAIAALVAVLMTARLMTALMRSDERPAPKSVHVDPDGPSDHQDPSSIEVRANDLTDPRVAALPK
jgi:hypothetical protein